MRSRAPSGAVLTRARPSEEPAKGRLLSLLLLAVILLPARAWAHAAAKTSPVEVTLAPVPASLKGLRIQLLNTVAPQLVIENPTDRLLEVYDGIGRPFLRIGPDGTRVNVKAADALPSSPTEAGKANEHWTLVSKHPSWGWIDQRLRTDTIKVADIVAHGGRATRVGRWVVPVRFGGVPAELTGDFMYEPPSHGYFSAQITSGPEVAPGVHVTVVEGKIPGLYLQNDSGRTVTVRDGKGEPFLRIGARGVFANIDSSAWRQSGRAPETFEQPLAADQSGDRWQQVSGGSSYSWLELRAWYPESEPPARVLRASKPAQVKTWEVPISVDDHPAVVKGVTRWIPFQSSTSAATR